MSKKQKEKKLTKKEMIFVEEYIRCWNGAAAARSAGYSANAAKQIAYENLTKPYLQAAIEKRLTEIRMSLNEFYARLSEQARANIADFIEFYDVPVLDRDGKHVGERQSVRVKQDTFERYGHLVKSIAPTANGDFKVELYSAQTALELTGKTHSAFVDRDKEGNPIQPIVNVYIPKNDRDDGP